MLFNSVALSAIIFASNVQNSDAFETIDVAIIGAGSAGASAAREFKEHNNNAGAQDKIKVKVFEANDRVGGRIMDLELGGQEDQPPTRTSGGFDSSGNNIGCHCSGDECPKFQVEVGAGWFTGAEGPDGEIFAKTCEKAENKKEKIADRKAKRRARKRAEVAATNEFRAGKRNGTVAMGALEDDVNVTAAERRYLRGLEPADEQTVPPTEFTTWETTAGTTLHAGCDVCSHQYNKMYALSQKEDTNPEGQMEGEPLMVNCNEIDGQDDFYGFLDYGDYYGYNSTGHIEMKSINKKRSLPGFNTSGIIPQGVRPKKFIDKFMRMLDKCIDYQSYQLYYQYEYNGCAAPKEERGSPFYYTDSNSSIDWETWDVGFDQMPDDEFAWELSLFKEKRISFCRNFTNMVQAFESGTTEKDLDAQKMYNFFKNFEYFAEYLSGQYMSFGNWGDDGMRPWGYNISYSIDQRGLKKVVESILPSPGANHELLLKHKVTNVDYTVENSCPNDNPVKIAVDDLDTGTEKIYCAKRVISTVSVGVLENKPTLFEPQIDMSGSPFEGMGELVKIYFRFPETFWGEEEYLTYVMTEDFRVNKTDGELGTVRGEYFYNLNQFFLNQCLVNKTETEDGTKERQDKFCDTKSLFTFLSTPDLKVMGLADDSISDADFANKVLALLDPMRVKYGDNFVEPDCWEFYDWNDENHAGAYGVWKRGATYCDHIDFFTPRKLTFGSNSGSSGTDSPSCEQVLYISGEASCLNHWGFIEGAYEAGARDAKLVINDLLGIDAEVFSPCGGQYVFDQCYTSKCLNFAKENDVIEVLSKAPHDDTCY